MKKTDSKQSDTSRSRPSKTKTFFQYFFEKALGPQETPKKHARKSKTKKPVKEAAPRVSFNPMIAMLGTQPQNMDCEKEFVSLPKTILKIDNNHFALNNILENREMFAKRKLDYMDIKNLISLDHEQGWQFKIILEGGLLLCQMQKLLAERDSLLKATKTFIK